MEVVKKWNSTIRCLLRAKAAYEAYQRLLGEAEIERLEVLDSKTQQLLGLFKGVRFSLFLRDLPGYYIGQAGSLDEMLAPEGDEKAEEKVEKEKTNGL